MEKVIIGEVKNYEKEKIKDFLQRGLNALDFNFKDKKVLLKPNLLGAYPPERAVTTHPEIIKAITELLIDKSCKVYLGDSPGYESIEKVLKKSGFLDMIKYYSIIVVPFNKRIVKKIDGVSPYKEFILGENPENYELIINLPKLKTHTMMGLTLGVKNTFGFIHALDKAKWHLRAGKDRSLFAMVLIDIHRIVNPHLTVLDGILGMDGEGPSNGNAKAFGLLGMSKNAFILDHFIERMIGIDILLPISKVALKYSLIGEYEVINFGIPEIKDFSMPKNIVNIDWNLPRCVKGILKNLIIKKPKLRKDKCKSCGVCVKVCPAFAIDLEQHIKFDYKKCIRCYCCQEMCPNNAIEV